MMNKSSLPSLVLLLVCLAFLISCSKNDASIPDDDAQSAPSNLPERVIEDTAYATADPKQKMDIYLPAGRTASTRLVILIHGGAWEAGDKNEVKNQLLLLKSKWPEAAYANINYRLANGSSITYDQIMNDVASAINFLATNKGNFNISDTIALWGASAGAHLALQYAYTKNTSGKVFCVAALFGPAVISDWDWYGRTIPLNVKNILTKMSGSVWNQDLYNSLSPFHTATSSSKPTIIFHGNLDPIVPVYQSQWFYGKLKELGVTAEYHEYTDFHGFTFDANNTDCANKTIAFFKKHMK